MNDRTLSGRSIHRSLTNSGCIWLGQVTRLPPIHTEKLESSCGGDRKTGKGPASLIAKKGTTTQGNAPSDGLARTFIPLVTSTSMDSSDVVAFFRAKLFAFMDVDPVEQRTSVLNRL